MHSLKNTVVAVGLLGLSFMFYQSSSKPGDDGSDIPVPTLEISEGMEGIQQLATEGLEAIQSASDDIQQIADDGMDTIQSKLASAKSQFAPPSEDTIGSPSSPILQVPDLTKRSANIPDFQSAKQAASEFANEAVDSAKQELNSFANNVQGQAKEAANSLANQANAVSQAASSAIESTKEAISDFQYQDLIQKAPMNSGNDSFEGNSNSQFQPVTPSSNTERDAGLIAALDSQNSFQAEASSSSQSRGGTEFIAGNSQPATPEKKQPMSTDTSSNEGAQGEFQFASLVPENDGSFNSKAADDSSAANSNVVTASNETNLDGVGFEEAWQHIDGFVEQQEYRTALRLLSNYYRDDSLNREQRKKLMTWLDALAGKVIFSAEHHLAGEPYTVAAGDDLGSIAAQWNVPAQLVYNVNRVEISDMNNLVPGTQLKRIPGPFVAEVSMKDKMFTLFLGELYAGRYPVRIGISGTPRPGTFDVMVKSAVGHSWRDATGQEYPPNAPENGYGPYWIGLAGSLCIHAVPQSTEHGHNGCIGLRESEAKDVFAILGKGSSVTIR